jgi:tetratricopeptide (TPR) repeat protein
VFLPSAGLAIALAPALAWAAERLTAPARRWSAATAGVAAGALAVTALAAFFAFQTNDRLADWADLETFLEATIDDDPDAGIPHLYLAHVYARAGRADETRVQFVRATESNLPEPSRGAAWYEYALWLDGAGSHDEARDAFEQALTFDPDSPPIRRDFAASQWRRAMATTPPDRELLTSALAEAERAAALDPLRSDTLVLVATIALDLGDNARARSAFEAALLVEESREFRQRIRAQLDALPR